MSGWMFLLVPAHPGRPGQRAVNGRVCVTMKICPQSHMINTIKRQQTFQVHVRGITRTSYVMRTDLAKVVRTLRSDGLEEQFLTADTLKQLTHFLHEFLSPAHH